VALLPVSKPKARSHVHSVAEVLDETFGFAEDAYDATAPPVAVVRLHFRASIKNAPDHDRMLAGYGSLRWQEPADTLAGDGAATPATLADEPDA
jgi:GTP-binding protein HflX